MSPYRPLPVVQEAMPICADCTHLRPSASLPDRVDLWRCHAEVIKIEPRWIHPITGTSVPERALMRRCEELNGEGQCTQFSPMTLRQRVARHPVMIAVGVVLSAVAFFAWLAS